jgi:inhibitor of cysteine peptidase
VLTIDQSYDGKSLDLPVGQVIELRLPENPTTGFTWHFDKDGAPACTIARSAFTAGANRPGAGGEHAWDITAVTRGNCEIALVYRRPSDAAGAPAQTFRVIVHVT